VTCLFAIKLHNRQVSGYFRNRCPNVSGISVRMCPDLLSG